MSKGGAYEVVQGDIIDSKSDIIDASPSMVEVPLSPRVLPIAAPASDSRGRFFVNGCCCCCSLASGVTILALFDLLQGLGGLMTMITVVFARTHEHALDKVIADSLLNNATTATAEVLDDVFAATTAEEQISMFNHIVEVAANWLPLALLCTCIMFWFASIGFKAARGDVVAAYRFYRWKLAHAIFAVLFAFSPNGLARLLLSCYFAVVARSHWVTLKESQLPSYFVATMPTPTGAHNNTNTATMAAAAPAPAAVTSTPIAFVGIQAS